jgi:hypothetical protein
MHPQKMAKQDSSTHGGEVDSVTTTTSSSSSSSRSSSSDEHDQDTNNVTRDPQEAGEQVVVVHSGDGGRQQPLSFTYMLELKGFPRLLRSGKSDVFQLQSRDPGELVRKVNERFDMQQDANALLRIRLQSSPTEFGMLV